MHRIIDAMNKKILIAIIVGAVVIGAAFGWSEYNRGKTTADEMPIKEVVTAQALFLAFSSDEEAANARFVGTAEQVIQVSGAIRSIEPVDGGHTNVVLETGDPLAGVVCEFANEDLDPTWRTGAAVKVNGFCSGLLLDVVLVRCVPVVSN